jgi:uncharacterized membrane protein
MVRQQSFLNQRVSEIDITRGLFIILVTWVHVTFFVGARSLGEIFFDTVRLPEMSNGFYVVWVFSEQLAPAGFFILLGIGLAFSSERFHEYQSYLKHHIKRGAFIMLMDFIIRPLWLLAPLEVLNVGHNDNATIFFVFGIYLNLGISVIVCALLDRVPSYYLIVLGITGLVWSGLIDVFDDFFDDYKSLVTSLFLLPGINSGVKTTFNIIPWVSYSLLGLSYGRVLVGKPSGYVFRELFLAVVIITSVILIRLLAILPEERFWFLSKYPPNLLLSGASIVLTILTINVFRLLNVKRVICSVLESIGQNALLVYSLHFPLFILTGFILKQLTGAYLNNGWVLHGIWVMGLFIIYRLTYWKPLSGLFIYGFDWFKSSRRNHL